MYIRLRTQWLKMGLDIFTEGWEHNGLKWGINIYKILRTQWYTEGWEPFLS